MKKIVVLSIVLAFMSGGCARKAEKVALQQGTPAYQLAKDLAAKVPSLDPDANSVLVKARGIEITTGEVIQAIEENIGTRVDQLKKAEPAQIKSVIERAAVQLGEKKLLLAEAGNAKTAVPAADLDNALKAEYQRAGGEQGFMDTLKANGLSIDHVRKSLEEQLLINRFLDATLLKEIKVSAEEIQKAYAEDKTATVRHILLLTQGKSEQEKTGIHKKMEDILSKAKAGEDFGSLAKQYSEDPASKDKGGLYEDFGRGSMVKPFEDAAFTVPVGEISGIVETTYGFHLLQIVGRKKEIRPFDQAKGEIEAALKLSKQSGAFSTYITDLRKKTSFETVGF